MKQGNVLKSCETRESPIPVDIHTSGHFNPLFYHGLNVYMYIYRGIGNLAHFTTF